MLRTSSTPLRCAQLRNGAGHLGLVLGWLVAFLSFPEAARAGEVEDFQAGRAAYREHDYRRAIRVLEAGLDTSIQSPIGQRESRKYLGASYYYLGTRARAEREFRAVLNGNLSDQLDPLDFSSDVRQFFERVRRELRDEPERRRREARNAKDRRERRRAVEALVRLASTPEVLVRHDPGWLWLPFGAGQFQNGNEELGWFFLVAEAVTGLASAGLFAAWLVNYQLLTENPAPIGSLDEQRANALLTGLQVANWSSFGLFTGLLLAGVIESHVNFVASHVERGQRPIPEQLLRQLQLSVTSRSIELAYRGRF